jgi:hypothetical protein
VKLDSAEVTLPVTDVAEKINVPYNGKEDVTALLTDAAGLTVQFDVRASRRNNLPTIAPRWPAC